MRRSLCRNWKLRLRRPSKPPRIAKNRGRWRQRPFFFLALTQYPTAKSGGEGEGAGVICRYETTQAIFLDTRASRSGKFDGKFLIGVRTTGIYCLPSCPTHPPKPGNVTLYRTEAECVAAGLRACKRCRPDLYYRGEDENASLFEGLAERVRTTPDAFAGTSALARSAGVSLTKLTDLFRDHAHLAPAQWLRRERVARAATALLTGEDKVVDIGFAAGFESESVFHRQFLAHTRMTPGAYRALRGGQIFLIQLPGGYRAKEVLAYHARDPEGLTERQRRRKDLEGACHA